MGSTYREIYSDPLYTPGVETVAGGITYRESHLAIKCLRIQASLPLAQFVEVNPILDEKNKTADVAVAPTGYYSVKNYYEKRLSSIQVVFYFRNSETKQIECIAVRITITLKCTRVLQMNFLKERKNLSIFGKIKYMN